MNTPTLQTARYNLFAGAMQVDNVDILTRTRRYMDRLVKKAYTMPSVEDEVEYITKEEQLAMIREGLLEVKRIRESGGKEFINAYDLIDEL